jgi:hypothetical protein
MLSVSFSVTGGEKKATLFMLAACLQLRLVLSNKCGGVYS